MDESRFKEQAAFVGHPYQLQCPLKIVQSTSQTQLTWQKDCVQLPTNESKIYLDFNSLSLEDQGNYTCKQQSNSTVTFTVRLLVKGKVIFQCARVIKLFRNQWAAVEFVCGFEGVNWMDTPANRYFVSACLLVTGSGATWHEGLYCLEILQWTWITAVCLYTESQCSKAPEFKPNGGSTTLWENVGSTVKLNCTALLFWDPAEKQCDTTLQWSKDGHPLNNHTLSSLNTSSWWFEAVEY